MADLWADFRFLQYNGQDPSWDISDDSQWWVLTVVCPKGELFAKIPIMPSRNVAEIAIDAGLEFLDRLRDRRVPKFIDSPDALMSFCVKAAVRQG